MQSFLLAALRGSDVFAQESLEPVLAEARSKLLIRLHAICTLDGDPELLEAADAIACHSFFVGFCLPETAEETELVQQCMTSSGLSVTTEGATGFHLAATAMYRSLGHTCEAHSIDPASLSASLPAMKHSCFVQLEAPTLFA